MDLPTHQQKVINDGFTVIENIYDVEEIKAIIEVINQADHTNPTFRKTDDLFAIRRFLKEMPTASRFIFNNKLKQIIADCLAKVILYQNQFISISPADLIGLLPGIRILRFL